LIAERMEGTVAESDLAVLDCRLVAGVFERFVETLTAEAHTGPASDVGEHLRPHPAFPGGLQQDASCQLVTTRRDRDLVHRPGSPVELGGTPRPRPGASGQAPEFDVE